MPRFEIEENGKRYQVEAPDAQSAIGAIGEFRATPQQRITGAFEAAQPVRQVERLVEPREGLLTSRNRFGDVGLSKRDQRHWQRVLHGRRHQTGRNPGDGSRHRARCH